MQDLPLLLIAGIVLVGAIGLAFWCNKSFETAIFLVALSPLLSAVFFPSTPDVDIDAAPEPALGSYMRIGLLSLTGAVGLLRFIRSWSSGRRQLPLELLLLGGFLFFALLSTGYSIDQRYTFIRSASFFALFGFLLGLYSWIDSQERLNQALFALFGAVSVVTAVNIAALVLFPGRAWYGNRFQGLWSHPNAMGVFCMLAYPLLLWVYPRCTPFKKTLVAAQMMTLFGLHLLTGSRGSLMAAVCGIFAWSIIQRKPLRFISLLGVISTGALIITWVTPSSFEREGSYSATDLTDRPEFWSASLTLIRERPMLGYGYAVEGGVWTDPRFNQPDLSLWTGTARTSLHNGYLSVAVGLGIGALLIWCVLLFMPLWRFRHVPYSDYKGFVFAVMVSYLLLNGIETEIGGTAAAFWIVWIIGGRVSQALSMRRMPAL
jgi:O-antigen ligase